MEIESHITGKENLGTLKRLPIGISMKEYVNYQMHLKV